MYLLWPLYDLSAMWNQGLGAASGNMPPRAVYLIQSTTLTKPRRSELGPMYIRAIAECIIMFNEQYSP